MAGRASRTARKKKRTARLEQPRVTAGWTENKVRVLSTKVLLERLASFSVVTTVDEFVAQARAEHAANTIAERWRERFMVSPGGVDADFMELAACVLWERLLLEPATLRDAG